MIPTENLTQNTENRFLRLITENVLNCLGTAGLVAKENRDRLAKPLDTRIGCEHGFAALCALHAIEIGSEREASPSHLQIVAIQGLLCVGHAEYCSFPGSTGGSFN